jgi:hypothetical protein
LAIIAGQPAQSPNWVSALTTIQWIVRRFTFLDSLDGMLEGTRPKARQFLQKVFAASDRIWLIYPVPTLSAVVASVCPTVSVALVAASLAL